MRLIYFINSKYDRNTCCCCMINGFLGLGHYIIIGSYNNNCDIGHLCTTGTHCSKCLMSRSIEERNLTSIFQCNMICTNMLCDTSGFTCNYICFTNVVKQRSFTMVYVSHDCNNRSTMFQIFRRIFLFNNGLGYFCTDIFSLKSKFFSHKINRFCIQTLIDRNHHTNAHTSSDNLIYRYVHHACQFISSHKFCQFQYLAFCHFLIFQFLHTVGRHVTFFFTIFGTFVLTFACQTSQRFFNLLCYIFFAYFLLYYRLFEAVFIIVITVSILSAATLLISSTVIIRTLTVWSRVCKIRSNIVHIYFFLIIVDAITFLLTVRIKVFLTNDLSLFTIFFTDFLDDGFLHLFLLILTKLFLLFTLFPLFLFRFLLRTCRLI